MDNTKLLKKLLITEDKKILVLNPPDTFLASISDMQYDLEAGGEADKYDYVQLFAYDAKELEALMEKAVKACEYDGLLWACYPKGTSTVKSDIKRGVIVDVAQKFDVRPVTQVAIDDTWSAMRLRPFDRVGK